MILIQVIQQQVKLLVEWGLRLIWNSNFLATLNIGLELNSTIEKSNAL
jgi:hypothetical protein